jgi:hypothetical protein
MRRLQTVLFLALVSVPLAGPGAGDPVASDMRQVLSLAFADAAASIQGDPAGACAQVEHTRQVFGALVTEYSTRSGDQHFRQTLRDWFYAYCGHGPEASAPSDGD